MRRRLRTPSVTVHRADAFEWLPKHVADDSIPLIVTDPPYGRILKNAWDQKWSMDNQRKLTDEISRVLQPGGTAYVWGGIGKPGDRLFFSWLSEVEHLHRELVLWDVITWKKRRAYGTKNKYLFTREECAMLVKGDKPKTFNIPLLEEKRGYAGYKKSEVVGYFDGIYHGIHKNAENCDMSSRAQTQGKRSVYELLRQAALSLEPGVPQTEASGLVRKEPRTPSEIRPRAKKAKSGQNYADPYTRVSAEERDFVRLDGRGFERGLDRYMPGVRDTDRSEQCTQIKQLLVSGQNRQLCWVCTWEHMRDVLESQQVEDRCLSRGVRSCGEVSPVIRDVEIIQSRVKYPAKSEYLRRSNVWTDVTELFRGKIHDAEKPSRLAEIMIETSSNPGDLVLDPFAGSGSTGVAAKKLRRSCILLEIDPKTEMHKGL